MNAPPRVAVVTGAGTGIGRAAALSLSRDGFNVALLGRRLDKLEETAKLAASAGARVFCADIDEDKVARLNRCEVPIVEHRLDDLGQRLAPRGEGQPQSVAHAFARSSVSGPFLAIGK